MKRYDVYWVDLDPTKGSEIRKTRPCVIISPNELNEHLTSKVRGNYPFRLNVYIAGKEGQIAIDQVRTIDKLRLKERISTLSEEDAERLRELLNEMFCEL